MDWNPILAVDACMLVSDDHISMIGSNSLVGCGGSQHQSLKLREQYLTPFPTISPNPLLSPPSRHDFKALRAIIS